MDARVELSLINKHIRQHNREAGEYVVWYEFVPLGNSAASTSLYDDVYDEGAPADGGRAYAQGLVIPTVYVEEIEDRFTAQEEGRQPTQNLAFTLLYKDIELSGLSNPEEYNAHLNDVIYYAGRYYKIHEYKVRGRLPTPVVVGVVGYEVFLDQEFVWDPGPGSPIMLDLPWPTTFPVISV